VYRHISIQQEDFSLDAVLTRLKHQCPSSGGLCFFIGAVRDTNLAESVGGLFLEHYPGMTEAQLNRILDDAQSRWPLAGVEVIHRVGALETGDNIVLVAVAAMHRGESFAACEMIMDYLKTQATFWKKEQVASGERWLEARASDGEKLQDWTGVGGDDQPLAD
jgi:molybdopterin synthase catalytic subunit